VFFYGSTHIPQATFFHSSDYNILVRTIIIGLGNPLLGDDSLGWRVAEQVRLQLNLPSIGWYPSSTDDTQPQLQDRRDPIEHQESLEVDFLSLGGLSLMERLEGYDRAILIDAISLGEDSPGTVTVFRLEEMPDLSAHHLSSTHDTNLPTALRLGQAMGAHLPHDIYIVGVEAKNVYDFTEDLTPSVAEALPLAVQSVINLLSSLTA